MVQQAYTSRGHRHRAARGSALSALDLLHPAASATVAAGLKPGILTLPAEKKRYGGNRNEYLEARDFVLLQWEKDKTRFLSEEAIWKSAPDGRQRFFREVYRFLMQQGCINLGFLRDDPLVPLPEGFLPNPETNLVADDTTTPAAAAVLNSTPKEEEEDKEAPAAVTVAVEEPPPEATDDAVEDKLYEILAAVDLQTTTEKKLRAQLSEFFKVEMSSRKALVRDIVTAYLSSNGPSVAWKERKAKETAAAAQEQQENTKKAAHKRRSLGKIVVIGAGPAGLSAALHLKRNNVDVVVLEARDRVGGRVNSYGGDGFGAPVDLGASIITGIEMDTKLGLRADPSALLCSQLGVKLHELQSNRLPLYDGKLGGLGEVTMDEEVERLRDEMLDDVADFMDEMTPEELEKTSLGGMLTKSFEIRKNGGVPVTADTTIATTAATVVTTTTMATTTTTATAEVVVEEAETKQGGEEGDDKASSVHLAAAAVEVEETVHAVMETISAAVENENGGLLAPMNATTMNATTMNTTKNADEDGILDIWPVTTTTTGGGAVDMDVFDEILNAITVADDGDVEAAVAAMLVDDGDTVAVDAQQPENAITPTPLTTIGAAVVEVNSEIEMKQAGEEEAVGVEEEEKKKEVAGLSISTAVAMEIETEKTEKAVVIRKISHNKEEEDINISIDVEEFDEEGKKLVPLPKIVTEVHRRFLNWHWANLEYGCSAPLSAVSVKHWNQDEDYGGFGGPHCMVVGGYDQAFRQLASLLDVRMNAPVATVKIREGLDSVEVITAAGESFWCDAVVVSAPLGVLKSGGIAFEPPLPPWKQESIDRLGFGDLNKVVLQFPTVFWDDSVDFFGAAHSQNAAERGFCFMWWNFHRFTGLPILVALVAGEAAHAAESASDEELREGALAMLRGMHPGLEIPHPVACTVSRWAAEEYSKGSYSYVSVGASGDDYDKLAIPVGRRILFAGEHTSKEHCDTVGGAMLSGLREGARALELLDADKREGVRGAALVGQAVAELKRKHAGGGGSGEGKKKKKKSRRNEGGGGGEDDDDEGDDSDAEYGEDDVNGGGGKRGRAEGDEDDLERRFDGVLGYDIGRVDEHLRQREASRAATKEVWRCLMAAELGDVAPILEVVESARDAQSRQTVSSCLVAAASKAVEKIAADVKCLEEFGVWVAEAAAEAAQVAVLDLILKMVRVLMPIEGSLAKGSGLMAAVKRCVTHGDPDIRKLAGSVMKMWTTSGGAAVNGGGGRGLNGENGDVKKGLTNGSGGGAYQLQTAAEEEEHEQVDMNKIKQRVFELDEQAQRQLEEAEAEMRRLEALAATLAEEAAAAEAEAEVNTPALPSGVGMSWKQYEKKRKAERKEETRHKSKLSVSDGGGEIGGGEIFDFQGKVDAFIKAELKKRLDRGAISQHNFSKIFEKASAKVMSKVTAEQLAEGRPQYEKRKKGILELVNGYVKSYKK